MSSYWFRWRQPDGSHSYLFVTHDGRGAMQCIILLFFKLIQVSTKHEESRQINRSSLVFPGEERKLSIKDLAVLELGTSTPLDVVMDACWEVLKELQNREWHSQLPPRNHWF